MKKYQESEKKRRRKKEEESELSFNDRTRTETMLDEENEDETIWLNSKFGDMQSKKSQNDARIISQGCSGGGASHGNNWPKPWLPSSVMTEAECNTINLDKQLPCLKGKDTFAPVYNPKDTLRLRSKLCCSTDLSNYTTYARSLTLQKNFEQKFCQDTAPQVPNSTDNVQEKQISVKRIRSQPAKSGTKTVERRVHTESGRFITVPSISISAASEEPVKPNKKKPVGNEDTATLPSVNISSRQCGFSVFVPAPAAQDRLALPLLSQPLKAFMPPRRRSSQEYGQVVPLPPLDPNCTSPKGTKMDQDNIGSRWPHSLPGIQHGHRKK